MKTKLLLKAALVALIFTACSKEDSTNNSDYTLKNESDGSLYALEQSNRDEMKQYFTFDAGEEAVTLTSESGVEIRVDPSRLTYRGRRVQGTVKVEYMEVFGLSSMVTTGLSTMGVAEGEANEDSALRPLISGGEFFVNMTTEDGQRLDDGSPYTLAVPTELTGGEENSEEMIIWVAQEDEDGDVVWEKDLDDDGNEKEVPVVDGKYIMELLSFGLCNIDKFEAIAGEERTPLSVDVPDGYDDTNSSVYVAYQGNINLLGEIKFFDPATQMFEEYNPIFPVGATVNVIFVSGQGSQWLFAVKQVTLVGNDIIVIDQSDLNTTNNPGLIAMLNSL